MVKSISLRSNIKRNVVLFCFDSFDWQHSKHVQHTHTQRVFEFFWTLTNKRRSCVRFVSKSWRYPESIPKLPQKVLKMTPGRPPGGSKNVNKSWFFTFWAKSQNRRFFIKKQSKQNGFVTTPWPPLMDPKITWWILKITQNTSFWGDGKMSDFWPIKKNLRKLLA